ncbi:MAG TPA: permease prefix domain 1-containing protein [Verrucomicrobiae bacterium]|nr:permease prefix domain 1-containing protein [Verrucomicrobiae bacterium]
MLAAGVKNPTPLEELESHLREDIAALQASGLTEADAFQSAVQKIGPPPAVHNEFKKVAATNTGLNWKHLELLFAGYALLFPLVIGSLAYVSTNGDLADLTPGEKLSALAAAITFSLLAYALRVSHEKFPLLQTNRIRDVIFVPVMLWLVILAYVIMPHTVLASAQKTIASLWGLAPFGIIIGWCWGFATTSRKNLAPANI